MDSFLCGQRVGGATPPHSPRGTSKALKTAGRAVGRDGGKAAVINELAHVVRPSPGHHHHTPLDASRTAKCRSNRSESSCVCLLLLQSYNMRCKQYDGIFAKG